MNNNAPRITWGFVLVLIGLALAGRALGFVTWDMIGKLILAFIFIVIGLVIVTRSNKKAEYSEDQYDSRNNSSTTDNKQSMNHDESYQQKSYQESNYQNKVFEGRTNQGSTNQGSTNQKEPGHSAYNHYSGILGGQNIQFVDEVFTGAIINSILGNVQLDLRNAIFIEDAKIELMCILGGVDIFIPSNIKVVVNCTPILAGVDSKIILPYDMEGVKHTLFISGTCILGGIEIK